MLYIKIDIVITNRWSIWCYLCLETQITIVKCHMLVDEQKELMRKLLFLSTNMAAMTSRKNHL